MNGSVLNPIRTEKIIPGFGRKFSRNGSIIPDRIWVILGSNKTKRKSFTTSRIGNGPKTKCHKPEPDWSIRRTFVIVRWIRHRVNA